MQQELLEARKNGTYIKDANERRAKVAVSKPQCHWQRRGVILCWQWYVSIGAGTIDAAVTAGGIPAGTEV